MPVRSWMDEIDAKIEGDKDAREMMRSTGASSRDVRTMELASLKRYYQISARDTGLNVKRLFRYWLEGWRKGVGR
jgi:hypothetical protein